MASIKEYFKDKDIFITGGTGFMGKVLVEKLLRSCGGLNKIFILIRSKRGRDCKERLDKVLEVPLFDVLRKTNPSAFDKIVPINGDMRANGLGISEEDFELLKNVAIVYHTAATVRFDEPLQEAIIMNTKGTHEVIKLSQKFTKLEVLVHISTSYCYPNRHTVDEKLYPPYGDWRTAIKLAEKYDTETLNVFTLKYTKFQPNTYTYTKCLAEHCMNDYKDKLPIVIFRPSIVISTVSDPFAGWMDNLNGPVGMFLASGLGILRTLYGDADVTNDYMPVDVAIKALIICAYKRGIERKTKALERPEEVPIYNCSSSSTRPITAGLIIKIAQDSIWDYPLEKSIWVMSENVVTKSRIKHYIKFITLHILVAIFVDSILRVMKKKPMLLKLQRRIYAANLALYYFATTTWKFPNGNFIDLDKLVPEDEFDDFAFYHQKDLNLTLYFKKAIVGAKQFLLKESVDDLTYAKRKFIVLYALDKTIRIIFFVVFLRYVYKYFLMPYLS